MNKILRNVLSLGLSAFLAFQVFPTGTFAQADSADSTPAASETTKIEAEWEGTGLLNEDGSPVLAEQGDTAESGGALRAAQNNNAISLLNDSSPAVPANYTLTLNLDGGQVNNLQNAGWNQSAVDVYQWTHEVTEATSGSGYALTVDNTLGGLLPAAPYRAGYNFTGWEIGEIVYNSGTSQSVPVNADTTITAQWTIAEYTVSFQANGNSVWTVTVPYGATLWTEPSAPWTAEGLEWTNDTTTVNVTVGSTEHNDVTVTRYQQENSTFYYYTFTIDNVPYFTYGGPEPTVDGQHFVSWKLLSGGAGFTVTDKAVFTAQFQADQSYVFNVYFYYENGMKAADTFSVALGQNQIENGQLSFPVGIPSISYYTYKLPEAKGVTWQPGTDNTATVTVNVDTVFGADNTSATNFLALTVLYSPAEITYTVEYYQQELDGTGSEPYQYVGKLSSQTTVEYGSKISIQDAPNLGNVNFGGFLVSPTSQSAITEGVVLREGTLNVTLNGNTATVKVYYDRASYFIYFQTGTAEVQIDPVKVAYGDKIPDFGTYSQKLTRAGYQTVTEEDITLYSLNADGVLQEVSQKPSTMPAYDLYAVVTWTPATTSIRLVYWVESRNAASFQNAHTVTVEGMTTEAELKVGLAGDVVTISGAGWPTDPSGSTVVSTNFDELMRSRYGSAEYNTFFSYSAENTKKSPGNVANAQVTNPETVTDGAIAADSYTVKVNGDGSTTINIYYTRNLYTVEFVLARINPSTGNVQIALSTPGSYETSNWQGTNTPAETFNFEDFTNGVTATELTQTTTYGGLTVEKTYQLTNAMDRDTRSPIGRYGKKTIQDKTTQQSNECFVYTLTARFEADVTALWPTPNNIQVTYFVDKIEQQYISMGTDKDSYYRNKAATTDQKNILNAYSTMDRDVIAAVESNDKWSAISDPGEGDGAGKAAHQMIAYWNSGAAKYNYYFLYEVLDTTVSSTNVPTFSANIADSNGYEDDSYVVWGDKVYVYSSKDNSTQYSTFARKGQNQPARQGFISSGKSYEGIGDKESDDQKGGNIYFFYTRERYTLDIQNVSDRYSVPKKLLTTNFACLSDAKYGTNVTTLQQLGWEEVNLDGTVSIRFGATLEPLQEEEITGWLTTTGQDGGNLTYPLPSSGENQYYFWRWYRNSMQTVPINWETDNDMKTMASNTTVYAGWFSPRYTTTYTLNGGTWMDGIHYTLTDKEIDGQRIYIYYPHQADSEEAPLYWYIQSNDMDRLFVDKLYACNVGDVARKPTDGSHWVLNENLNLEELKGKSTEDFQGSRLVNQYYCYMGQGEANSHLYYVNINSTVNTVLDEPDDPVRTGYTFSGWFYFDDEPTAPNETKTYLAQVLTGTQSLASYDEGYVYLNHVGDAYLLHKDENGQLFYYPDQTGYRFSYTNDASVVSQTRQLYAAWQPKGDAKGVVYHLVKQEDLTTNSINALTPRGEQQAIPVNPGEEDKTITIGKEEYYILKEEDLPPLYTGTTYPQTAWEYCTDNNSRKWLPVQAQIDLHADERTQTVTDLSTVTGNTYRIQNADGTYTYYAFFVYGQTNQVTYHVYAIDLAVAVAEDVLDSYQDTFARDDQMPVQAPYLLDSWDKDVPIEVTGTTTFVTENAPTVSGYSVYQDWVQTLQLQTNASGNNIFFYYVSDKASITYDITFYLMTNGDYSAQNTVTISHIPAVAGEILPLTNLQDTYDRLLDMAEKCSAYKDSTNEAQKSLYDRYKGMTITLTKDGEKTSFTVNPADEDSLNLADIADYSVDYYVNSWSPTGETVVLSDGMNLEVYLANARLIVQKTDTSKLPLQGATFALERLVPDENGDIEYEGKNYSLDKTFEPMEVTSGKDGQAIFYNLSARLFTDENGGAKGYLYRLTETQAPKGYNGLQSPLYITTPYQVSEDEPVSYSVTYTVVNTGIAYLPQTGSFGGVYTVMFLGTGLMAVAVCGAILTFRRRNPSCPSRGEDSSSHDVEP